MFAVYLDARSSHVSPDGSSLRKTTNSSGQDKTTRSTIYCVRTIIPPTDTIAQQVAANDIPSSIVLNSPTQLADFEFSSLTGNR